jgi:hypothetical protein
MMMRRYTKALLLLLAALFYAGTASAVSISVVETSAGTGIDGSYYPTDIVTVDIVIDTEGTTIYGFTTMIEYDDTVLSAVSAVNNPVTGLDPGYYSPYIYPNAYYPSAHAGWYLGGVAFGGVSGVLNVATLVFHVMDVPASSLADIVPTFDDAGFTQLFVLGPGGVQLENADVTRNALTIHVPEPTTTMLMGLGLFGILYAGRRR